jgi:Cyclin, N-terminal domain
VFFQDVSNANRNVNGAAGKNGKAAGSKRTGVKTRSMSSAEAGDKPLVDTTTTAKSNNEQHSRASKHNNNNTFEDDVIPPPFRSRSAIQADPMSYQVTGSTDNIDERDHDDPLCVTGYVEDMYNHYRAKELTTSVRPLYMENQPHINERMRSILVDWLVEVHLKFKLVPETLYLTINLIDRYLEKSEVSRPKLQLVGVTSLLIASKYEEIYPPELRDLVYICDRAYTKQDVRCCNSVVVSLRAVALSLDRRSHFPVLLLWLLLDRSSKWKKGSSRRCPTK